jgi:hypothetical protein
MICLNMSQILQVYIFVNKKKYAGHVERHGRRIKRSVGVRSFVIFHYEARFDAVGANLRRIHGMAYDRQRVESAGSFGA